MSARDALIQTAKIGLPLTALALVAAVFAYSETGDRSGVSFDGVDLSAISEGLKLTNPQFTGATSKGEPFRLTADWALPDGPSPEEVELSNVTGEMSMADGRHVEMEAQSGLLEPKKNVITLSGLVGLTTSDGYVLKASSARLDADRRLLTAEGPITATGPLGAIKAGSLRVERDAENRPGDSIWFKDQVKVRIDRPNMADTKG